MNTRSAPIVEMFSATEARRNSVLNSNLVLRSIMIDFSVSLATNAPLCLRFFGWIRTSSQGLTVPRFTINRRRNNTHWSATRYPPRADSGINHPPAGQSLVRCVCTSIILRGGGLVKTRVVDLTSWERLLRFDQCLGEGVRTRSQGSRTHPPKPIHRESLSY